MLFPAMTVPGPVLVTARSACVVTVVVGVELLLPEVGSVVEVVALAVLLRVALLTEAGLTAATCVNVAVVAAAIVAIVSLTALPLLERVNAVPNVWVWETKAVPMGSVSESATFCASLGPLLISVTV